MKNIISFILEKLSPFNVYIMVGLPGSGKSTYIKEELPKSLLTSEQFEYVKTIKFKPQAIKYIHACTDIGIKMSAIYYDTYIN